MQVLVKKWHISARDYPIDMSTKIHAGFLSTKIHAGLTEITFSPVLDICHYEKDR